VAVVATLTGPKLKCGLLEPEAASAIAVATMATSTIPVSGHNRRRRRARALAGWPSRSRGGLTT
jgi:hypothetical protein